MDNLKFSAFDQIGYLLVGSIALLVILIDYYLVTNNLTSSGVDSAMAIVIFIVLSYCIGHIIQACAHFLLRKPQILFNNDEKDLLLNARTLFKRDKFNDYQIYRLIFLYSQCNDTTGQVNAFNSYLTLYRGWSTVFIFEALFMLMYIISIFAFSLPNLIIILISIILSFILYNRYRIFSRYLKEKVFNTYIISQSAKL